MYVQSTGTEADLELEYSPSLNSKRFLNEEKPNEYVLENFVKVIQNETERVRNKYHSKLDVRYGGEDDNQLLDIFFKETEYGTPIFVYIHGGFWQCLDKSTSGSFVAPLVERNWRVLNVDYNLCPPVNLKTLCDQMWNFYKWLFKYAAETEANSIVVCGHSAGAHLASLMFTEKAVDLIEKSKAQISFFLISGLYDLRELWNLECSNPNNVLNLTTNSAAELSPLCWELNSKLISIYATSKYPVHILIAENDSETFKGQSRALTEKLTKLDLNAKLKIFENYDHFDIIEEAAKENSQITKYILENLKL